MQLAIAPVSAPDLRAGSVVPELWEDVFLPPRALWLRQATELRAPQLDVRLEGPGLVFSSAKPAEEGAGIVLRCYNAGDAPAEGIWRLGRRMKRALLTRADEREGRELPLSVDGQSVRFRAGPRAIVTVILDARGIAPGALKLPAPPADLPWCSPPHSRRSRRPSARAVARAQGAVDLALPLAPEQRLRDAGDLPGAVDVDDPEDVVPV